MQTVFLAIMAAAILSASYAVGAIWASAGGQQPASAAQSAEPVVAVMLNGGDLFMDLDAPAASLLGFDETPTTRAGQDEVDRAHLLLKSGAILEPSRAAQCVLTDSFVIVGHRHENMCSASTSADANEQTMARAGSSDGSDLDANALDVNADDILQSIPDVVARWTWKCAAPDRLRTIESELFDKFAPLESLQATIDDPIARRTTTVTRQSPHISLQSPALHE